MVDIQSCTLNMLSIAHMLMFIKKSLFGKIFSFVYMIFSVIIFSLFKQLICLLFYTLNHLVLPDRGANIKSGRK